MHYNNLLGEPSSKIDYLSTAHSKRSGYSPSKKMKIAGIDTLIVDPHNEVFPSWDNIFLRSAVLLHIDHHPDMKDKIRTLESACLSHSRSDITKYSKQELDIESFISAGVHLGMIGVVYHIDPRFKSVFAFGRVSNGKLANQPTTTDYEGFVRWKDAHKRNIESPFCEFISYEELVNDLRGYTGPIICDLDLDAFNCVTDIPPASNYDALIEAFIKGYDLNRELDSQTSLRLQKVVRLLSEIQTPDLITIARSQTPKIFTPADSVDIIEATVINELSDLYGSRLVEPVDLSQVLSLELMKRFQTNSLTYNMA
jgi:hypothetical protein